MNATIGCLLPISFLLVELKAAPQSISTPITSTTFYALDISQPTLPNTRIFLGASITKNKCEFPLRQHFRPVKIVAVKNDRKDSGQNEPASIKDTDDGKNENDSKQIISSENEESKKISICKVENETYTEVNLADYKEFKSENCYLIKQENPRGIFDVFYWIGNRTSSLDAGDAAIRAIIADYEVHDRIKIRRETDGEESPDFKAIFSRDSVVSSSSERISKPFDANKKGIFLFEGKNLLRIRKMKFSLDYALENDNCQVIVSKKVYISCGSGATERQKKGANEFAKIILQKKGLSSEEINKIHLDNAKLSRNNEQDSSELLEEFQPTTISQITIPDEFRPDEVRRILGQTEIINGRESFDIVVYKIYDAGHLYPGEIRMKQMTNNRNLLVNELNAEDSYVIDSRSNAGLFVWMGQIANISVRAEAAKKAEYHLKEKKYDNATPISFVDQRDVMPSKASATVEELIYFLATKNDKETPTSLAVSRIFFDD